MRIALLAVGLTLAALPARAAETRTIKSLVELAMEKGEPSKLRQRNAKMIGMPENTPSKMLWFDQGVSKDGNEHVFDVLMKDEKPLSIRWQFSRMTEADGKKMLEGYSLLLTTDGKLKGVWKFEGRVGSLVDKKLSGKAAKAIFDSEREFWTKTSTDLEWSK